MRSGKTYFGFMAEDLSESADSVKTLIKTSKKSSAESRKKFIRVERKKKKI